MIAGKRKAGILIILLENKIAKIIFKFLSKIEKQLLITAISEIGNISNSEKTTVLREALEYLNLIKSSEKPKIKTEIDFWVLIFLFGFLLITIIFLQLSYEKLDSVLQKLQTIISFGGGYFILFPIILYFIKSEYKQDLIEFGYKSNTILKDIFIGIFGAVFVSLFLMIINFLNPIFKLSISGIILDIYIFVIAILAPVTEEIIFRGCICNFISKKFGKIFGITVSSLIFSISHLPKSLFELLLYFIIGIILGSLYKIRANLISCTIAHSIANLSVYL